MKRLEKQNRNLILQELSSSLNNTERKEGKLHKVFETSFDWKECRTDKFIQKKLDYLPRRQAGMHWNPCKGNKLVELPEQHEHSSARFYIMDEQGVYPITSFMELRDIDSTNGRK